MTVSVLIVNYRTPGLTVEAIESALCEPEAKEIIVVENASSDGSWDLFEAHFGANDRVRLIKSDKNVGFGGGNNLAARSATQPLLFLLNSDATFDPGCLAKLVDEHHRTGAGIVAPRVRVAGTNDTQHDAAGTFPTAKAILFQRTKNYADGINPDFVSGCAMLIRRDLFLELGGFDEKIFMYFEDVLLCWQVAKRGLGIRRVLGASVQHHGGKSYHKSRQLKSDYFTAQDQFLVAIGDGVLLRTVVKITRWPVVRLRSLRSGRSATPRAVGR